MWFSSSPVLKFITYPWDCSVRGCALPPPGITHLCSAFYLVRLAHCMDPRPCSPRVILFARQHAHRGRTDTLTDTHTRTRITTHPRRCCIPKRVCGNVTSAQNPYGLQKYFCSPYPEYADSPTSLGLTCTDDDDCANVCCAQGLCVRMCVCLCMCMSVSGVRT